MNTNPIAAPQSPSLLDDLLNPYLSPHDIAVARGITLTELAELCESPEVAASLDAIVRISRIRTKVITAAAAPAAAHQLSDLARCWKPEDKPTARETARRAASAIMRAANPPTPAQHRPRRAVASSPAHATGFSSAITSPPTHLFTSSSSLASLNGHAAAALNQSAGAPSPIRPPLR